MLIRADARQIPLVDGCVQCCVTSPPYWGLRDYGAPRQIGLEPTPDAYVQTLVQVFREVWRVLKPDGTCWLNVGDSYSGAGYSNHANTGGARREEGGAQNHRLSSATGCKPKDLVGIPWRVAFALQGFAVVPFRSFSTWADELKEARTNGDWIAVEIIEHKLRCMDLLAGLQASGWYLRSDIIWSKPNPMPESVTDRPTKAHEYLFLLSKRHTYYYNADAIREPLEAWEMRGGVWKNTRGGSDNPKTANSCRRAEIYPGMAGKALSGNMGVGKMIMPNPAGRNKRSVWTVAPQPYTEAHFATWPPKLIEPCILAGSRPGDLVLDPFIGSGTTGAVCERLGRRWVGCDLTYQHLAKTRTAQRGLRFIMDEASA